MAAKVTGKLWRAHDIARFAENRESALENLTAAGGTIAPEALPSAHPVTFGSWKTIITCMKTFLLSALLGLFAFAAFAADVTGKWTAEVPGRSGNMQTNTFVFKADGAKLTGTLNGGRGGDVELTEGKIDGDNISFVVVRTFGDNTIKQTYKGKVSGSEIKFTRTMEGGQGGGQPGRVEV